MALEKSVLYNFLSEEYGISAHFLEGQEIIQSLATISNVKAKGFAYLRDIVLTSQTLISFLSRGEGFGLYIDSAEPYFRFKIESSQSGQFRTLLIPNDFEKFPSHLNGVCRLTKTFKSSNTPYTSVTELKNTQFKEVMENVLRNSYQIEGKCFLSESSDQSLLLVKVPPVHLKSGEAENFLSPDAVWEKKKDLLERFFATAPCERKDIIEFFDKIGLSYLGEKTVSFHCPCSREQMLKGLKALEQTQTQDLFEGKNEIETRCDYCQTFYLINKEELKSFS